LIGAVAEVVGRNPYTLKAWETKQFVPPATKINNCRVYSDRQVFLLKELATFMDTHHYLTKGYGDQLTALTQLIWSRWNGD
jgi:DNA-binding transcriptional MerR regulator